MRIAVLSDIHANLVALDAVLAAIGAVDAVWHLGDVVGYGPEPDAVVDRLRALGAIGVRGNHDAAAVGGHEIDYFNADARRAMEWTRSDDRGGDPGRGSPRCPSDGSRATSSWSTAARATRPGSTSPRRPSRGSTSRSSTAPFCLHGHTHLPSVFRDEDGFVEMLSPSDRSTLLLDGRRLLANPGSVGQPRDGDPRSSALVLDPERLELTWHRVAYDIAAVQSAMRRRRLPDRLVERLSHGL